MIPHIARRNTAHGSGLGTHRWPVECTIAWLHAFKKPRLRTERRADIHQALISLACSVISLACSVICLRQLILKLTSMRVPYEAGDDRGADAAAHPMALLVHGSGQIR